MDEREWIAYVAPLIDESSRALSKEALDEAYGKAKIKIGGGLKVFRGLEVDRDGDGKVDAESRVGLPLQDRFPEVRYDGDSDGEFESRYLPIGTSKKSQYYAIYRDGGLKPDGMIWFSKTLFGQTTVQVDRNLDGKVDASYRLQRRLGGYNLSVDLGNNGTIDGEFVLTDRLTKRTVGYETVEDHPNKLTRILRKLHIF